AARLYAIVEVSVYQDSSETEAFQDAEYRLGSALARGGAYRSAQRYLTRVLGRGDKALFYQAALRLYVDVCIDGRTLGECITSLDRLKVVDQNEEITYLRGRAAFEAGQLDVAEDELKRVTPKSR